MSRLPIVALIGQTNAGKSSLLNRLSHQQIAIVAREEGTTRDNVVATIDGRFILVDTAGLKTPTDDFELSIQEQIQDAIDSADAILVTLDSTKYFDQKDAKIARDALKSRKPVFLILNKCDLRESLSIEEFRALGIKPEQTIYTSATTGVGTRELKQKILQLFPRDRGEAAISSALDMNGAADSDAPNALDNSPLKIALIGRPNVGKSSLFNALAKKQQAIVSSRQGTTRDINRVRVKFSGREIEILDTAGLRKPGRREVGIEKFSAIRTLSAIEEADISALLIDATEPRAKLDQTLAGQIVEAGKGIIIVVTKLDLLDEASLTKIFGKTKVAGRTPADFLLDNLEADFNFLPYAPVILTSSETGKNVTRLFNLALEVAASRRVEIKTADLNKILTDAVLAHPPAGLKNTRPKPKYIVQTDTCPPWFVVHGHDLGLLHWSWKRFLEHQIREKYPYIGTPIKISYHSDN